MCAASASERVLAEPFWKAPRSPERSFSLLAPEGEGGFSRQKGKVDRQQGKVASEREGGSSHTKTKNCSTLSGILSHKEQNIHQRQTPSSSWRGRETSWQRRPLSVTLFDIGSAPSVAPIWRGIPTRIHMITYLWLHTLPMHYYWM